MLQQEPGMDQGRHTWDSGWDNNDIGVLESSLGSIVLWEVASDFLLRVREAFLAACKEVTYSWRRDVGKIGGNLMLIRGILLSWPHAQRTPGVLTTSYKASSSIRVHVLRRSDNG